ncbi:MAG: hypothetical protein ACRDQU_11505 [Pseudonocardiaceae bacterium]
MGIRPPLDVPELCRRLAVSRGRPIYLRPWPLIVPGPFGLWIGRSNEDHIFYQQETTPVHQAHIILHEVGHVIADHPSDETDLDVMSDEGVPIRAYRRTCYEEAYEREAELVATIILEWVNTLNILDTQPATQPALVAEIAMSLGRHQSVR